MQKGKRHIRGMVVTLHPSTAQETQLLRTVGAQRWLWNRFLACNEYLHMFEGKFLSYHKMTSALPALKGQYPWLKEIPSQTLQQTLKRLDRAIKAVFQSGFGFPRFKSYHDGRDSALFPQGFKVSETGIFLPKVGFIPYLKRDAIHEKHIHNITVAYDRLRDRWLAAICFEEEIEPLPQTGQSVGLDAGSVRLYTDSDGNFVDALRNIPEVAELLDRIENAQRVFSDVLKKWKADRDNRHLTRLLSRKRKNLSTLHRKLADFVRDKLHKLSRKLVEQFDIIIVEALKLKNMTRSAKGTLEEPGKNVSQKAGLNRNLLSNRIATFFSMLQYKCLWYGKQFIKVEPMYTSQRCSACGYVHKDNRQDQAHFKCLQCGHEMNADHNAAVNILRSGLEAVSAGVWTASA